MVRILAAALLGSAAAFAPRAAPMTTTVVFAEASADYASMDGPALAASIDGKRKELFDLRLENRQGRQKTTFKSNVVKNLKRDIARMMPFLEAKQASSSPNGALREQAQELAKTGPGSGELNHLVERMQAESNEGVVKWAEIAKILKGRLGKQCRERWFNHLCPADRKSVV